MNCIPSTGPSVCPSAPWLPLNQEKIRESQNWSEGCTFTDYVWNINFRITLRNPVLQRRNTVNMTDASASASVSVAGSLTFSIFRSFPWKTNYKQNWLSSMEKCSSFGGFSPNPHQELRPCTPLGAPPQYPVIAHRQLLDPPLQSCLQNK